MKFLISVIIFSFLPNSAYTYSTKNISDLIKTPEQNINLAKVALELAQEFKPSLDIKGNLTKIDNMVSKIRPEIEKARSPKAKIEALNKYFYSTFAISYDLTDPMVKKANNRFLNGLLESKKGSCITLPLLYISIAQRLDLPIYPVLLPSHIFARYITPKEKINIEITSGGKEVPDSTYKRDFKVTKEALANNAYMKELSYKEYLSELVAINAIDHFYRKKDHKKGLSYMKVAVGLRPLTPELFKIKGQMHYTRYKKLQTQKKFTESNNHLLLANQLRDKAKKIGLVKLSNQKYLKEIKKKVSRTKS